MTIGERLREERQSIGMNQTDLAVHCGVTKNTQLAYEKGDRSPDAAYLARAAEQGVDVLYVVTGVHTPAAEDGFTGEEVRFIQLLRAMAVSDRTILARTAEAFAKAHF